MRSPVQRWKPILPFRRRRQYRPTNLDGSVTVRHEFSGCTRRHSLATADFHRPCSDLFHVFLGDPLVFLVASRRGPAPVRFVVRVERPVGQWNASSGTDQSNRRKSVQPHGHSFPVPIGRNTSSGSSREAIGFPQSSQITTVVGRSCSAVIGTGDRWVNYGLNRTRIQHVVSIHLLRAIFSVCIGRYSPLLVTRTVVHDEPSR